MRPMLEVAMSQADGPLISATLISFISLSLSLCLHLTDRSAHALLDSSSQFVFVTVARMSVRVFAWTICDSMCGDDEGIYSPGKACMCLTIVWSWYSYLDLRATADERTDLGV